MSYFKQLCIYTTLIATIWLLSYKTVRAQPLAVVGLFSNQAAAVITPDGELELLRLGERVSDFILMDVGKDYAAFSKHGVTQKYYIALNNQTDLYRTKKHQYSNKSKQSVILHQNQQGTFEIKGTINNQAVKMVLNPLVKQTQINQKLAEQLGVSYQKSNPTVVSKNKRKILAYPATINKLTLSTISLSDIPCHVYIDAQDANTVILGTNVLNHLTIRYYKQKLILKN